jgi:hypothetical protein
MAEIRRRPLLNYADPNIKLLRADPSRAWILGGLACAFLVGEIILLVAYLAPHRRGLIFCFYVAATILAGVFGLAGHRTARRSGSVPARIFADLILVGAALGFAMMDLILISGS